MYDFLGAGNLVFVLGIVSSFATGTSWMMMMMMMMEGGPRGERDLLPGRDLLQET